MSSEAALYGDPETRRRILQATWELLEQQGAGVKLVDVADRAGVTRQAVYLHFGDRSGLLVALVDYIDVSLGAVQLRAHIHGGATGVESLQRWIQTMSWYTAKIDRVTQVLESASTRTEARWPPPGGIGWIAASSTSGQSSSASPPKAVSPRVVGRRCGGPHLCRHDARGLAGLTRERGWTTEQYTQHLTRLIRSAFLTE